jgi:hypothetical protein
VAPRLSRWVLLTVIAAAVVATTLLTTGGTPLLFLWAGRMHQEQRERSQASRRIEGVQDALNRAGAQRWAFERKEAIRAVIARSNADPLVLKWDEGRMVIDDPATAAAASLWSTIPSRRPEVRTVVIHSMNDGWWGNMGAELRPDGVCVVSAFGARAPADLIGDLRTAGGECLYAEQFGAAGKGVRQWQTGLRSGLSWDRSRRIYWNRGEADPEGLTAPPWFGRPFSPLDLDFSYGGGAVSRLEMACLVGRAEECGPAAGVDAAGWPDAGPRTGYYFRQFPIARMPRDLLHELGPEKFAAIWTSEDPIGVSYVRATGTPMNGWIMGWGRRYVGTIHRDNGLSLVGWLGALIWVALLALLTSQRLKQRAVT